MATARAVHVEMIPLIRIGRYLSWSEEIRNKLQSLTLTGESGMRLVTCSGHNPMTCVAFIGSEPVGWALHAKKYFRWNDVIMIYVRSNYRRRGIGRSLAYAIRSRSKKKVVFAIPWSKQSLEFYMSLSDKLSINLED